MHTHGEETQVCNVIVMYISVTYLTYLQYFLFPRKYTVSGDANFAMSSTQLTVGGFTQPGVARGLIEMPNNAEKGFSNRFLWLFPNPLFEHFSSLGEVDEDFVDKISE